MKKFAFLAMLLGLAAFILGCPQGPDTPPKVDIGPPVVTPEIPAEEEGVGEAEEEAPAEEEAEEEEAMELPAEEEAAAEEAAPSP